MVFELILLRMDEAEETAEEARLDGEELSIDFVSSGAVISWANIE